MVLASEENFAAQSVLEESITLFREVQDPWGYALATMSLGYSAYRKDDRAFALRRIEQALTAFRTLGDQYFQSVCLYEIGNLRAKQGDWEEGLAQLRESLILSRELGSKYESASGLLRLAETEQHLGHSARAARLYWAARNVYDSIGAWHQEDNPRWEEHIASCSVELSESAFAEAIEEGRTMTMIQAIEYALESSTDG